MRRWFAVLIAAAFTNPAQLSYTATGTGATKRTLASKLSDVVSVKDFGAVGDGSTSDVTAINNAIAAGANTVYVPASTSCYSIGTTTITLAQGVTLRGAGMGGSSSGPSCITYTGTGCAILFESISFAGVRDLDLQINTTSATAAGICVKATTVVAEFNLIENVSIRMTNATRRTVGQVGLLLSDTGNGVYWNTFRRLRASYWDTAYKLVGGAQGVNANTFEDLMSWGHVTAFRAITANVQDNRLFGLHCSRSDGTYAGTSTCLLVGDDGSNVAFDSFYGVVSDQGAPSVCATIGTGGGSATGGHLLETACESGGPVTDNNNGTFPNRIYEAVLGSTPGRLKMARLSLTSELTMGATPSTTGDIRLSNNQSIRYRNNANGADHTVFVEDINDRLKVGSQASFLRLDNNIIEHGTGTVASSGSERYVHNWTNLGRNNANNANRTIWSWGATADQLDLGDANTTVDVKAPLAAYTNGTLGTPTNGTVRYCSDCTIANPCAGAGNGAIAKRLNGVWVCN